VEQNGIDLTPEEELDEKSAAACSRGFMRTLMTSGCDIFAGRCSCTSFFLYIQAPRGAREEHLLVKNGFTGTFKKLKPVMMNIQGKEGTTVADAIDDADLVWYQCGKAFKGFKT